MLVFLLKKQCFLGVHKLFA